MGVGQRKFTSKETAQKFRRKGETVVAYKGGYQLRKRKKQDSFGVWN